MSRSLASDIGVQIGRSIPTVTVLQRGASRLWLMEQGEPFAELDIEGERVNARFSAHCAPAWAGIVVTLLYNVVSSVAVHSSTFIQRHDGDVLYGADAENYWLHCARRLDKLLTARFSGPQD